MFLEWMLFRLNQWDPSIGLTAGRDADITAGIKVSASCTLLTWVLHTPVIRSIPQRHIHSRPPGVLI